MSTNEALLVPRRERGWWMGLGSMLSKELAAWWRTRRWWVQCLVAVLLLNGDLALNLRGNRGTPNAIDNATMAFLVTAALFVPVAAVSLAQDSILGEKHSGTAAWVFSKPLRRPAYLLAKLIANGLGLFVAWVALPGVIGYLQLLKPADGYFTPLRIAGVMGLHNLNLLFFLTLALMLATFFNGRAPVLGISLVLAWAGPMPFLSEPIQKYTPWLYEIMPWKLLIDFNTNQQLAFYLANGQPLPTVTPIIATALWCVLFTIVAIWRMSREEF
ncbi:MAG TPA: ABC transporter permease subunit [Anaerolineales bacterium]|nr:ABC transporter permease subunit [Anaerolineales bacterium]